MQRPPLRLGLTGGIGSGKSTVAAIMERRGAAIIDADEISRSMTASGGAAIESIRKTFGKNYIDPQGALNRELMRKLVYNDTKSRKKLEAIIHPLVSQQAAKQALTAVQDNKKFIVFDVPLLVESSYWRRQVEKIIVIDCTEKTQIERVMSRNGLPLETVEKIMTSQAPREVRLKAADFVICNDAITLLQLDETVVQLCQHFGL